MKFTIALVVSLFCGLILAQNNDLSEDSRAPHTCLFGCDLLKEFWAMKDKLEELETRLDKGKMELEELETKVNKERYTVAFTAATGGGNKAIGPFSIPTTLVYRTVKTNIGNFYNQHTGIFTAPVPGLYFFTYFYHAGGEQIAHLCLMKNDQVVVLTGDHKTDHDWSDNGGNAAYLQLQHGDQVYVRMGTNSHVWGGDVLTTFSGLLVRQD